MSANEERDPEPLGWNAIDGAVTAVYGSAEPLAHYACRLHAMLGGDDYLQGVSVFLRTEPIPHFHYLTYGFTELYEKEWKDLEWSGFGFELTFRLKKYEDEAPLWPISLLQNLARYAYRSGNGFDEGHYLDCRGKIALEEGTELCAILFAADPDLHAIDSPNGRLRFLQMIGITKDEQELIQRWNAQGFIEGIAKKTPHFVTDLYRDSFLSDKRLAQQLESKAKAEGSSSGMIFVGESHFRVHGKQLRVILGATAVMQVKDLLVPRLGFARALQVQSKDAAVVFAPGDSVAWKTVDENIVEITIPVDRAQGLSDLLAPKSGLYQLDAEQIEFEVRLSEIKDAQGNVVEVIG